MPSVEKLSVTLAIDEVKWARKYAKERKISFSAVLSEAMRRTRQFAARTKYLEWAGRGESPITPEEIAQIEAEIRSAEGANWTRRMQDLEDAERATEVERARSRPKRKRRR